MGLFKKKPKATDTGAQPAASAPSPAAPQIAVHPQPTPTRPRSRKSGAELTALRAEVDELRSRLEATEAAKALVEARLAALDATTTHIASNRLGGDDLRARINDLEGQVQGAATAAAAAAAAAEAAAVKASAASVAAVPHTSADPILVARVDALTARLEAMPAAVSVAGPDPELLARVEALAARVEVADAVQAQLAALQQRFDELQSQPATTDAAAITNGLAAQLAQLAERISASDIAARHAAEQVATLDQRLAAVSTELANQLRELGNDIDGLAAHQGDAAAGVVSDEVLDAIKSGQVKLAAEQARYEIAFRQDLAALAEQVRRGKA